MRWMMYAGLILIHTIKVAFESIDVSRPEAAELGQPRVDLLKWFRPQAVETALCIHGGLDETGVAQHAQVLGHGRLRHAKPPLDFSHRLFRRDQQAQYCAAVRFRDDFEYRFHSFIIYSTRYILVTEYQLGKPHFFLGSASFENSIFIER